jgi:hypothetical protein
MVTKTLDQLPPLPKIPPPAPFAPLVDRVEKTPEPVSEPEEQSIAAAKSVDLRKNVYIGNAQDALLGIPSELMRGNESIYNVIVKKNRLRGLGVLLVLIALLMAVFGVLR